MYSQQRGAVSIFVVIFAVLLITIITIGFTTIMLANQREATQNDLAQSAYDSALAGVEDAKRLLLLNQKCLEGEPVAGLDCARIASAIAAENCDTINTAYNDPSGERIVGKAGTADDELDQAYTCLKIVKNTNDYRRKGLQDGYSHVIPLTAAPGQTFDKIEIEWFTREDASAASGDDTGAGNVSLTYPNVASIDPLLPVPDGVIWGLSTPPIMRASLIQMNKNNFSMSQFNNSGGTGATNAATLFMYPNDGVNGIGTAGFNVDPATGTKAPVLVDCDPTRFTTGAYACFSSLSLPNPVGGDAANRAAYLRVTALYNQTRYRIKLKNGSETIRFYGVQPEVDVTGRANDLFRRIKARVQLDAEFPYPEAAVDVTGNLCKDFAVSSSPSDYETLNIGDECKP
jgi:hypothetical protein